ncbi:hypothetical protein IQ235_00960 [Oscillatoriales cyanobacterium LEGE 11467]|uniref:DUF2335 domain-containing protein n=1 Tax=Zarconia navalis LEGE 11467 TaxID=1828826 RepID=A0A928VX16_9CYAN|nr:hypothetical protein [Zarconia navalis]MBE9039365.1 hypothetical protein [Zarconia navalis LEGE 11467]
MAEYLDRNGKPLKGAALQSAMDKEKRQRIRDELGIDNLSTDDGELEILNTAALEKQKQHQRRAQRLQDTAAILGATCTAGLVFSLLRPALLPHATVLGAGLGTAAVLADKASRKD